MRIIVVFIILCTTSTCFSQYSSRVTLNDSIPLDPAISTGRLPNGLTYYLYKTEDKPIVTLVLKAGIEQQKEDQEEAAHILEHILLARNFAPSDTSLQSEETNNSKIVWSGSTSSNYTTYTFNLPDAASISMLANRLYTWIAGNAVITNHDIELEKNIVIEESRARSIINEAKPKMYSKLTGLKNATPKPFRSSLIKATSNDAIKSFYKTWYAPTRSAIIIIGKIDIEKTKQLLIKQLGKGHTPDIGIEAIIKQVQPGTSSYITETYPDIIGDEIETRIFFRQAKKPQKFYEDYRIAAIEMTASKMLENRMKSLYPPQNKAFPLITANYIQDYYGVKGFELFSRPKDGPSITLSLSIMFKELERLRKYGFTASEFDQAKADTEKSIIQENRRPFQLTGMLIAHFINGDAVPSLKSEQEIREKCLSSLKVTEVNEELLKWTTTPTMAVAIIAPNHIRAGIPTEAQIKQLHDGVKRLKLMKYEPKKITSFRVNFDSTYNLPSANKFTATIIENGLTEMILDNGAIVVVKEADLSSTERISFRAAKQLGTLAYSNDDFNAAKVMAHILNAAGLGELSKDNLANYLKLNDIKINAFIEEQTVGITGTFPKDKLEVFLQLLYRYFHTPILDSVSYQSTILLLKTSAKGSERGCSSEVLNSLLGYTVQLESKLSNEELNKIKLNQCNRIYSECFSGLNGYKIVFAGIKSNDRTISMINKYIGAIVAGPKNPIKKPWVTIKKPRIKIDTLRINNKIHVQKADVFLVSVSEQELTEKEMFAAKMLADVLESTLYARIRTKEAMTYSLNTNLKILKQNHEGTKNLYQFITSFSCDPARVSIASTAAYEEIISLIKNGPGNDGFNSALEKLRRYNATKNFNNARWSNHLLNTYLDGKSAKTLKERDVIIDSITIEDIREIARKYFTNETSILYVEVPNSFENVKL